LKILEKIKVLLIRYLEIKEEECKVIGNFVDRNLYWIDANIYEIVQFDNLIRAVNAIETGLKSLGLSRSKICLTLQRGCRVTDKFSYALLNVANISSASKDGLIRS